MDRWMDKDGWIEGRKGEVFVSWLEIIVAK
jgi:hypothetical protein